MSAPRRARAPCRATRATPRPPCCARGEGDQRARWMWRGGRLARAPACRSLAEASCAPAVARAGGTRARAHASQPPRHLTRALAVSRCASRLPPGAARSLRGPIARRYAAAWATLKASDGILVPGGFGDRGVEGKILAAQYAREHGVPYFGICLGFQVAVIEFARSVLGWKDAHSAEFDESTKHPVRAARPHGTQRDCRARTARPSPAAAPTRSRPTSPTPAAGATATPQVVMYMPEISKTVMGGTMRLGTRRCILSSNKCLASRLYGGVTAIDERHRHRYALALTSRPLHAPVPVPRLRPRAARSCRCRLTTHKTIELTQTHNNNDTHNHTQRRRRYEVNPQYVSQFNQAGLQFVGQDVEGERMEIFELTGHRYYVGCQYHPEFKSRPGKPSALFHGLLLAASKQPLP